MPSPSPRNEFVAARLLYPPGPRRSVTIEPRIWTHGTPVQTSAAALTQSARAGFRMLRRAIVMGAMFHWQSRMDMRRRTYEWRSSSALFRRLSERCSRADPAWTEIRARVSRLEALLDACRGTLTHHDGCPRSTGSTSRACNCYAGGLLEVIDRELGHPC